MEIKNTFKYHFILGLIIVIMDVFGRYVSIGHEAFVKNLLPLGIIYKITFYITFFSVYAINVNFVCPKTLERKNLFFFVLGLFSLFFVFPGIRYFLEEIIVYSIWGVHNYYEQSRTFWFYIFDNSYYSVKVILFSTFIYLLFIFLKNKNKIHQLELEQQKAEMGALKMQLEPHFLFNTLNVFYTELVESKPETAKGIYKLSELLRYLTYEGQKEYVSLQKELAFINDYLFFYKKRFENNLYLDFSVNGKIDQQQIPSLILIHFIENIFKHGVINDKNNPVKISIHIESNTLVLETSNKISEVKNYSTQGIGRSNLEKRLKLLFTDNYTYLFNEKNGFYSTYLKIPLK